MKRRETELSKPSVIERAKKGGVLLKYLAEVDQAQLLGPTKGYTLRGIAASYMCDMTPAQMTSRVVVDYALWRVSSEGMV